MLFNSFDFLLFFTVVWTVQRVLPHRPRNLFLLAASYFFYGCWDVRFLSLILLSTVVDYACGLSMPGAPPAKKRLLLIASCVVNLGVLAHFKYAGFFVESAEDLVRMFGGDASDWRLDVTLPVGISFYTFQTLSYTIDIYRGQLAPLRRLDDFALFVAFFPQLVAGPIERGERLAPQMLRKTVPSWERMQSGVWLCLRGLFKKVVVADNLALIVDDVFSAPADGTAVGGLAVLLGVYAFAFQIYGDFSGYTDIARGTARMMGYDLAVNFRLPYFAAGPSEFWRRWHVSLSSWLRDYLYIPLGGNRGTAWQTSRNLMVTMLLGGLWHGAAWTFVLWGLYHGLLLSAERLLKSRLPQLAAATPRVVAVLFMFHLTCVGWLLFRAESVTQVADMLTALGAGWHWDAVTTERAWQLLVLCGPLMLFQLAKERTGDLELVGKLSLLSRTAVYLSVCLGIILLGRFGGSEFIYFQF